MKLKLFTLIITGSTLKATTFDQVKIMDSGQSEKLMNGIINHREKGLIQRSDRAKQ